MFDSVGEFTSDTEALKRDSSLTVVLCLNVGSRKILSHQKNAVESAFSSRSPTLCPGGSVSKTQVANQRSLPTFFFCTLTSTACSATFSIILFKKISQRISVASKPFSPDSQHSKFVIGTVRPKRRMKPFLEFLKRILINHFVKTFTVNT